MTEKQAIYRANSRRSKELSVRLEELTEEADYYDKALGYHSLECTLIELQQIRQELDTIWNNQVILFFEIQDDFKRARRKAILERVRPPKPKDFFKTN